MAVCGLRCIDLNNDTLKILGTHFSCNAKLKDEKKIYKTITDRQQVLKIWKMRNLTLKGKVVICKTIATSKIVFQSFITAVPKHIINELGKIQKAFLWKSSTVEKDHKAGGLKMLTFETNYSSSMLLDKKTLR